MLESNAKPSFTLPKLPYDESALEPVISARTLSLHHGTHHAGYVTKLNQLVEGSIYAGRPLDEVVKKSTEDPAAKMVFNNAAQAWNHDFYWRSMRPRGGGTPGGALRDAIGRDFGGVSEFRAAFAKAAAGEFGSGWAWLVADKGSTLKIAATNDADTPSYGGRGRCSPSTCGSTPIISTTRIGVPTTSRPGSIT